ncbi:hypothetical protein [Streptomyces albidochromogenes]|uniref:hypothetical protein n=1 Tax=Streptomyces albidochromogenes TaxID=329524 RepID=UPI00142F0CBA|nr:hypothetical protein [Streptomyces albidochromogenes]
MPVSRHPFPLSKLINDLGRRQAFAACCSGAAGRLSPCIAEHDGGVVVQAPVVLFVPSMTLSVMVEMAWWDTSAP